MFARVHPLYLFVCLCFGLYFAVRGFILFLDFFDELDTARKFVIFFAFVCSSFVVCCVRSCDGGSGWVGARVVFVCTSRVAGERLACCVCVFFSVSGFVTGRPT
jgi:hypothetical protein